MLSVYTVSGNIARIAAILPEFQQYCQNSRNINLHAKSSIAAMLRQYCQKLLLQCCRNIASIYCHKSCILIRYYSIISSVL